MHANLKRGFPLSRSAPLCSYIWNIQLRDDIDNEKGEARKANLIVGSKINLK